MSHFASVRALCILACAPAAVATATPHSAEGDKQSNISPSPAEPSLSARDWQTLARTDLAAFADALRENFIYAAYPDPGGWRVWFDRTFSRVEAEIRLIKDEAGYRAVLVDLAAAFQDSHVFITFNAPRPLTSNWPGFLARLVNGKYRITASRQAGISDGDLVSACDGKPISWWIANIARHEVGRPDTLDQTRNAAALRLFVDRGSPLRSRLIECVIGGRSVKLDWKPAPIQEIGAVAASWQGRRTPEVSTRLIGSDGAWVKLGYFQPQNAAQAKTFHAAIAAAHSLRSKRFIVLDVRGNGGGPYNWFMAYLRGLYGQVYADHHATERLRIRAVYRLSPAYLRLDSEMSLAASDFAEPEDPPYEMNEAVDLERQKKAAAAGEQFLRATPLRISTGDAAPQNPVRARVYVLTDYGCDSACIGFVDELKRFPSVVQIGLPTGVDNRSGTPVSVELPSKRTTAYIAAMTRDGRVRNDNEPQLPSIRFAGDIRDDQAVEAWFLSEVLAQQ